MELAKVRPCPECGGHRVMVSVGVPHGGYTDASIKLKQEERSISVLNHIKGDKHNDSMTVGLTCTSCGYTALFATDPKNLIPDQ